MIRLYGIANCDTVKKARNWLDAKQIQFEFVDFKKIPPATDLITAWLEQIPAETLLNKRGTTWRKLDSVEQASALGIKGMVNLMVRYPSIIKRPVLEKEGSVYVGFSDESYRVIFSD